jgi:hypothetical protein
MLSSMPDPRPLRRRRAALGILFSVALTGAGVVAAAPAEAKPGLQGHKVEFSVKSPDSQTACASWYASESKQGPAKDPAGVVMTLEQLPWKIKTNTGRKVGHWRVTAWATDDCKSTADPNGTVVCRIKVDGKVRAKQRTDAIAFCSI